MALFKIDDRYPNYKERFFDGDDIKGMDVYVRGGDEKVGSVHDLLVDETGRIRYLIIDTGFWIFGKKVLLPIGRCLDDPEQHRMYVIHLTKEQVESLPEYTEDMTVDSNYENQVRAVYRMSGAEMSAPVEMSVPVEQAGVKGYAVLTPTSETVANSSEPSEESDDYSQESDLYAMNDESHRRLRLYEERLVADKHREKTGEVTITKRIETEQVDAAVPVQKEKIVIEIESVVGATQVNVPDGSFQDGDVAQVDVYEERPNIHKEAVVRQEVNIRKEVEEDVVTSRETLRREVLDMQEESL
ncbi:MAG: DUF2382 domain-containing protein [Cyanobacteria bacterium P01_G01_bin.38]